MANDGETRDIHRPGMEHGIICATPGNAREVLEDGNAVLLQGISLTEDQFDWLDHLYGFEENRGKALRAMQLDGFRLLATLAPFIAAGDDPVKNLIMHLEKADRWPARDADFEWAIDMPPYEEDETS